MDQNTQTLWTGSAEDDGEFKMQTGNKESAPDAPKPAPTSSGAGQAGSIGANLGFAVVKAVVMGVVTKLTSVLIFKE